MSRPLEKTIDATLRSVIGEWHELLVRLRYVPHDPLAVRLDFLVAESEPPVATWVFARDLLATGLTRPSGEGDVRVRPHGQDATDVELISGRARCLVRMASAPVRDFVVRTRPAEEHCDEEIATALGRLLTELLPGGVRKNADS
ncbi:SsgA family sporulation/cell division regulator [Streptomyces purpureus]|uniref:SsgA family sporulation/cell division regulator n=1 Tax=Streptomyces purpureus TaxID=1951 RepID=UPI00378BCBCE